MSPNGCIFELEEELRMSVSAPMYGTLRQVGLRIARRALAGGERVRPYYLGRVIDLRPMPRSAKSNSQSIERPASRAIK